MTASLPLHPRRGTHAPTTGTPPRRANSIRRTSTVDAIRPADLTAGLVLVGRTRDLLTTDSGSTVVGEAASRVEIEYRDRGPFVTSIDVSPIVEGIETLVGARASSGFRARVDETAAVPGTGEYLLLDDIPVCTLVSGYAVLNASARGDRPALTLARSARNRAAHGADACAGFATGGTIMSAMATGRHAVPTGPVAPSPLDVDDPLAWHEFSEALPADAMRRWRRTDVWHDEQTGHAHVDSFYRDSHTAPGGLETIVHEYTVSAVVDARDRVVLECAATPRVLPFLECPPAANSAQRLGGLPLADLRGHVRVAFVGTSTCTHLNDQLRSLADVEHLMGMLDCVVA